jgi:hypothetical protein
MSLDIVIELWAAMKPLFATSDRPEAAEAFVNVLIEGDFDPKEIKKAFKKDGNIINALGIHDDVGYTEDDDDDEDGYEEYDDDEDDDY